MPQEEHPATPDPDEWDRQLRAITSGEAGEAKFAEPSAAERASRAASRAASRPAKPASPPKMSWRSARKARKLREPVAEPGRRRDRASRRRSASAPGYRAPVSRRRRRVRSAASVTAVLIAFVGLLYALHMLGLGPH